MAVLDPAVAAFAPIAAVAPACVGPTGTGVPATAVGRVKPRPDLARPGGNVMCLDLPMYRTPAGDGAATAW